MERRFGWLAFPGFLRFYALFHVAVYALQIFRPDLGMLLEFDANKIFAGEVWRMVTFLFASSGTRGVGTIGILFFFFLIMLMFMVSDSLESAWGVFRTSMFFYAGYFCLLVANFVCPAVINGSGFLIYASAFLAFATLFPRVELRLMMILPVQVRFLGILEVALVVLTILGKPVLAPFFLLAYLNYILFAGIPALRGQAKVMQSAGRRKEFGKRKLPKSEAFHRCKVCDRTEISDPSLEFRIGADGEEYCDEHLPKSS
jgi:hypothetical protein